MSLSISSTIMPSRAKLRDKASAVLDLPSPARVLVISRVLGTPVSVLNRSEARIDE